MTIFMQQQLPSMVASQRGDDNPRAEIVRGDGCIPGGIFYGGNMRVLVFAHIPPPFHGQSYMVRVMLENLGEGGPMKDERIRLFHLNTRLSDSLEDIGTWRAGKFFRLVGYIFRAWWMRWRYSLDAFYYIPAPPAKRGALYRDWIVLLLVGSLFRTRIFHWQAAGLGEWVRESAGQGAVRRLEASVTRWLFRHDLSCALNEWGRRDVTEFSPRHVAVVPNGVADPCPDYAGTLLPEQLRRREQRVSATKESPALLQLLYLALATRTKGLFDSVEAVALANARLVREGKNWCVRLTVAGTFYDPQEELAFRDRIGRDDLRLPESLDAKSAVVYVGHVDGGKKDHVLREADAFCFASYYPNEGQPVSVIEALAYGLPVVLTRWRSLPEMIPSPLAHQVEPADPAALADALVALGEENRFEEFRKLYLGHYTEAVYCGLLREAFLLLER